MGRSRSGRNPMADRALFRRVRDADRGKTPLTRRGATPEGPNGGQYRRPLFGTRAASPWVPSQRSVIMQRLIIRRRRSYRRPPRSATGMREGQQIAWRAGISTNWRRPSLAHETSIPRSLAMKPIMKASGVLSCLVLAATLTGCGYGETKSPSATPTTGGPTATAPDKPVPPQPTDPDPKEKIQVKPGGKLD
jgi:hypothetical protein